MSRKEFPKEVKRAALKRANGKCEAEGERYGLRSGQQCNAPLSFGFQYDHGIADSGGGEPSLENCVVCCLRCHDWKTRNVDTPRAAKIKRQRLKGKGGERRQSAMPGSRLSRWKRKIGGGCVPRYEEAA